jgi:hypothetical protein
MVGKADEVLNQLVQATEAGELDALPETAAAAASKETREACDQEGGVRSKPELLGSGRAVTRHLMRPWGG